MRFVVETGASLANACTQQIDDSTATVWADLYKNVQAVLGEIQTDTNLMVAHSIAKSVFNHQQTRILEKKQNRIEVVSPRTTQQTPDDGLLRMCGAEICRMIKQRNNRVKRLKKCHDPVKLTGKINRELLFLKHLCISSDVKNGALQKQIPAGIKNLDQTGYMWVPRLQLLPFLRKVDNIVQSNINECSFQKNGENLFKTIQHQLNTQRDNLYSLFLSGVDEQCTDTVIAKSIYNDLWGKMMNLRKEEWRASRERLLIHKEGKTSSTTLMLRDELKPHVVKKITT